VILRSGSSPSKKPKKRALAGARLRKKMYKDKDNINLSLQLPKLPNGEVPEVKICVSKTHYLGKVAAGEYYLETPYQYASSRMMPLPAVRRLMDEGELPYIRFAKESYLLCHLPTPRGVKPMDGLYEPML
jgi:hypothetical protein